LHRRRRRVGFATEVILSALPLCLTGLSFDSDQRKLADGMTMNSSVSRRLTKQLRVNRQGGKYILLKKLADRTGTIPAAMM